MCEDVLSGPVRTDTHTRSNTLRYVLIWNAGKSRTKAFYLKSYGIILALHWLCLGTTVYLSAIHTEKDRLGDLFFILENHVDHQTGK